MGLFVLLLQILGSYICSWERGLPRAHISKTIRVSFVLKWTPSNLFILLIQLPCMALQ